MSEHEHLPNGADDFSTPEMQAAIKLGEAVVRTPQDISSEFVVAWQNGQMTAEEAIAGIAANFKTGAGVTPSAKICRPELGDIHFWTDLAKLAAAEAMETKGDVGQIGATVGIIIAKFISLIS